MAVAPVLSIFWSIRKRRPKCVRRTNGTVPDRPSPSVETMDVALTLSPSAEALNDAAMVSVYRAAEPRPAVEAAEAVAGAVVAHRAAAVRAVAPDARRLLPAPVPAVVRATRCAKIPAPAIRTVEVTFRALEAATDGANAFVNELRTVAFLPRAR